MKKSKLREVTVGKYRFTVYKVPYEVDRYVCDHCALKIDKINCLFDSLIKVSDICGNLFGVRYAVYKYEEVK